MRRLLVHPFARRHGPQFLKFAVCGGIGAVIDFGSLAILVEFLGVPPQAALFFSSLFAMVFVFLANKFFTFRNHDRQVGGQAAKFLIVYGLALLFNASLSNLFLWLGAHYALAKALAVGVVMFWNYALSHGFIFRSAQRGDTTAF